MIVQEFDPESNIVWLRDPLQFAYLREGVYTTTRGRGRPHADDLVVLKLADFKGWFGG